MTYFVFDEQNEIFRGSYTECRNYAEDNPVAKSICDESGWIVLYCDNGKFTPNITSRHSL